MSESTVHEQRTCPTGVTIHDPRTDELRFQERWTVIDKGQFRTLRLTLARGVLIDETREGA